MAEKVNELQKMGRLFIVSDKNHLKFVDVSSEIEALLVSAMEASSDAVWEELAGVHELPKCCVCKKYGASDDDFYCCERCDDLHHEACAGAGSGGTGEYPHEDAYSVCKNCIEEAQKAYDKQLKANQKNL